MQRSFDNAPWATEFQTVRRQRRGPGSRAGGRHGHGRRGDFGPWGGPMGGPPPWVAQMFGPGWGGPGPRGGRRPRVRRGDVRSAILDVLATTEEPLNGYQVIQQIAERTDGAWKPSPGSIYPTIAQLVDEGLLEEAAAGRKTLQVSASGRRYVEENADEIAAVWAGFDDQGPEDADDLRQVIGQTVGAIIQVASTGSVDQRARAVEILADTRRKLYGLLAEGPEVATDSTTEEE